MQKCLMITIFEKCSDDNNMEAKTHIFLLIII